MFRWIGRRGRIVCQGCGRHDTGGILGINSGVFLSSGRLQGGNASEGLAGDEVIAE
jgi:hypothetical protein